MDFAMISSDFEDESLARENIISCLIHTTPFVQENKSIFKKYCAILARSTSKKNRFTL